MVWPSRNKQESQDVSWPSRSAPITTVEYCESEIMTEDSPLKFTDRSALEDKVIPYTAPGNEASLRQTFGHPIKPPKEETKKASEEGEAEVPKYDFEQLI